jgi:hypothetical protein
MLLLILKPEITFEEQDHLFSPRVLDRASELAEARMSENRGLAVAQTG